MHLNSAWHAKCLYLYFFFSGANEFRKLCVRIYEHKQFIDRYTYQSYCPVPTENMFIALRRKHLQLAVILLLLLIVSISLFSVSSTRPYLFSSSPIIKPVYANSKVDSYLDRISNTLLDKSNSTSDGEDDDDFEWDEQESHQIESFFNKKVEQLYKDKVKNDHQDKFWLLDTDMTVGDTTLNIPKYYAKKSKAIKPTIQPFDPRFTLSIYFHSMKEFLKKHPNEQVELPFHWYDWIDLSALDGFLIANTTLKPDCSIVDATEEKIIHDEKKRLKEEKKKAEEKKKEDEEKEKERLEEEKKKEEEKIEEEKKKEEERKKEEEKKKEHENVIQQYKAEEAKKAQKEEERAKEQEKNVHNNLDQDKKVVESEKLDNPDLGEGDYNDEASKALNEHKVDTKATESKKEPKEELKVETNDLTKEAPKEDTKQETKEASKEEPKEESKTESKEDSKEDSKEVPELESEVDSEKPDTLSDNSKEKRDLEIIQKREIINPSRFCLNNSDLTPSQTGDYPGFNVFDKPVYTTRKKAILVGRSFLYSHAPPPSSIIFLTKEGSYNISVSKRSKLLDNGLVEQYVQNTKSSNIDVLKEYKELVKQQPPNIESVVSSYHVDIPEESFNVDPIAIISSLKAKGRSRTKNEQTYLESLEYSELVKEETPKYFAEASILGDLIGDHYDWRFYQGIYYGTYEQSLILHRMIRTWLSFTRKHGVTTWVAHGSLLSWYWNGMAFPWDNDIDVQVPIHDLHKLSLEFNQTLIVEDPEDGFGRYFLDCGTFITLREKGNGNNNIDARFIDIDTGLYVDITGLAISNTKPPLRYELPKGQERDDNHTKTNMALQTYNCRNNHFTSLDELTPLIKTSVEGELGYIPKKYSQILTTEYKDGFTKKQHEHRAFLPQLRLWLREDDLYYFFHNQTAWVKHNSFNEKYIESGGFEDYTYMYTEEEKNRGNKNTGISDEELTALYAMSQKDLLEFLTKDEVFMSFYATKDFTYFHEDEIMRLLFGKSTSQLIHNAPDFKPMLYDPFLFKRHSTGISYDAEIDRYARLFAKSLPFQDKQ